MFNFYFLILETNARWILLRSKPNLIRVIANPIFEEETILASVISLLHVPYVFDIPSMSRYNS